MKYFYNKIRNVRTNIWSGGEAGINFKLIINQKVIINLSGETYQANQHKL